ncbi:hypothetical protein AB0N07_49670 [Streptomyces sp. NPDC051172]|uniref:hypothetical protein n=1 Tax=Streptomyces sp. NPDC051172 TaxID=3155796 RepID=UPI00343293C5
MNKFKRLTSFGEPTDEAGPLVLASRATRGDWISEVPVSLAPTTPWWEEPLRDGTPAPPAPWRSRRIPAGVWLFRGTPPVADADVVARIPADPERLAVVVGGAAPESSALAAVTQVLSVLPPRGERSVRLFLPYLDPKEGIDFARANRLDLVASPANLSLRGGLTHVSGADCEPPDAFWQWYRTRFGETPLPCGALYPQPAWEAAVTAHGVQGGQAAAVVTRVPAGFAVRPLGKPDPKFLEFAVDVPASPDRLRVVVGAGGTDPLLMAACHGLLDSLPTQATRQVELVWPYAGTREAARSMEELAALLEAPVVAPAAGLARHPNGHDLVALHEDGSLGHWVRFGPDGAARPHGPLSPPPSWGTLAARQLAGLPDGLPVAFCPAGFHLRGSDGPHMGALAARLAPERTGITLVADGDARNQADRHRVLELLEHFGTPQRAGLRVVMHAACEEGTRSFGQALADRLRGRVLVATDESIQRAGHAAPDGWQPARLEWRRFQPGVGALTGGSSVVALPAEARRSR